MATATVYGFGGFDPSKPNSNIIEQVELPDDELTNTQVFRESAIAKLAALGLTAEEAQAIIGS